MTQNLAAMGETTFSLSGSGTLSSIVLLSTFLIIAFGIYTNIIRSGCKPLYDSYDPDNRDDAWDIQIHNFSKWSTNLVMSFNLGVFMAYFVPNATVRRPSLILFAIIMGILSFQTLWYLYKLNDINCPEGKKEVTTAFPIYYSYFGWSVGVLLGALADNIFGSYSTITSSRIALILLALQVITMLGLGYFQVDKCDKSLKENPTGPMEGLEYMQENTKVYKWWSGIASIAAVLVLIGTLILSMIYPDEN